MRKNGDKMVKSKMQDIWENTKENSAERKERERLRNCARVLIEGYSIEELNKAIEILRKELGKNK